MTYPTDPEFLDNVESEVFTFTLIAPMHGIKVNP